MHCQQNIKIHNEWIIHLLVWIMKTKCIALFFKLYTTWEMDRAINVLFATNSCLNRFILLKKCTKNHKWKGNGYIFRDLVLDSAKTGTRLAQRGGDNDSVRDESVLRPNSNVTIATLRSADGGSNWDSTGWTQNSCNGVCFTK